MCVDTNSLAIFTSLSHSASVPQPLFTRLSEIVHGGRVASVDVAAGTPVSRVIGMYLFTYLEESRRRVLLRARGAGRLFSTFVDLCSSKI
jgi:hypothetical protein